MSAPKSYRKVRNRKLRGRQKQALHNYCSDVDLLVPTFVHDAAWYYW
jgi:DNA-binding protein Fis